MERNLLSDSQKEIPRRNIRPCLPPPLLALLLLGRSILTHVAWISPAHTVRFLIPLLNLLLLVKICTQSVRHWWARSANPALYLTLRSSRWMVEFWPLGFLQLLQVLCQRRWWFFVDRLYLCMILPFGCLGQTFSMVGRRRSVDWWNEPTVNTCV